MIRLALRILLIGYLVLPVLAVGLLVVTVRNVQAELDPIYQTAVNRVNAASEDLQEVLNDLRDDFRPLVDAMNTVRSGLSAIRTFLNDSINAVIGFVNGFPSVNIARFNLFTLPSIINLNFLDDIGDELRVISDEIRNTVNATTAFVGQQAQMIGLAAILFGAWAILSHIMVVIAVWRSLWR